MLRLLARSVCRSATGGGGATMAPRLILTPPQLSLPALLPLSNTLQQQQQSRLISFFKAPESSELWKTMQGVSQQGKKRGRGRNLLRKKNLNIGQQIGFGKARVDFPGLTSKVVEGTGSSASPKAIQALSEKQYEEYQKDLADAREFASSRRGQRRQTNPLERGWTGGRLGGRRFGPPLAQNPELNFDGFESVLLQFRTVFKMTGNLGRVRRTSILMVTGNGKGTFGFTVSAGKYGKNAASIRRAVNKAGLRLLTVQLYENRTVYHDFFSQFGNTRITVRQMPPGSGIRSHRVVKAICDMVGIKDLYAKVEGAPNIQHVVKAFVLGLLRQRSHQDLADEKGLHLVEMRPELDFFPRVLASPSSGKVRTQAEIHHNEILDFELISFEGQLPMPRRESVNPWEGTMGWDKHMRRSWAYESQERVRRRMRVEHGEEWGAVRSFLYPKYPECVEMNKAEFLRQKQADKAAAAAAQSAE